MTAQIAAQTARTPGPWVAKGRYIFGANGNRTVADCGTNGSFDLTEANAAFIVQACNAHDDLVAALKEAYAAIGGTHCPGIPSRIRAALAKAGAL